MKILYALDYLEGGTFHVAEPLACLLRKHGHEVRLAPRNEQIAVGDLTEFDLIHAWNMRAGLLYQDTLPLVQTINSFLPAHSTPYLDAAAAATRVHTHSPYVAQFLHGFSNERPVTFIPVAFDQNRCNSRIPLPAAFTLGWLGSDRSFKRFAVAREIAARAEVPYIEWDVDALHPWEKVLAEFFPAISCYLLASMNDAGPLPPQEALLFSRPVVSTPIGMMNMLIRDGINGKLFDGSVEDGVYAVQEIQKNFKPYSNAAASTDLPTLSEVLPQYIHLYEMTLEG